MTDLRASRLDALASVRVCLVATEAACRGPWREAVRAALDSGVVGMVQVREKEFDDDAFVVRAREIARLARRVGALVIVNDRAHLVAACGADGVHVGEDDLPPSEARRAAGRDVLVGVSAHARAEVERAAAVADYAGLGPCFASSTKRLSRAPRGSALVAECVPAARLPLFPIGGITPEDVRDLVAAGATRVAVGAGILRAVDPFDAAIRLSAALPPTPR